jgi:hypothetical protein
MRKRFWVNLALALIVLGLALAVTFGVWRHRKPTLPTLLAVHPGAVLRFAYREPHHPAVVFRKIGKQWWLVHPFRARAQNLELVSLIDELDEPVRHRYRLARILPARVGLAPPKLTLWVNHQRLAFGRTDPVGHERYIKVGAWIDLVRDVLYYRLAGNFYTLLSTRLLPKGSHITALHLPRIILRRNARGGWMLTPPEPHVSSGMIARLVRHWTYASALSVGPPGRSKSLGTVRLRLAGLSKPLTYFLAHDSFGVALVGHNPPLRWVFPLPVARKMLHLSANRKPPRARAARS